MTGLQDVLHIAPVAALFVASVAPKDALCLVVMAVDCDLHAGVVQLLAHTNRAAFQASEDDNDASLALSCAAAFGCRRAVMRLLQYGDVYAYATTDASCPLKPNPRQSIVLPAEVFYEAARRGDHKTMVWLSSFTHYDVHRAMAVAAASGHLKAAYWLRTNVMSKRERHDVWLLDSDGGVLCAQWALSSDGDSVFVTRDHGIVQLDPAEHGGPSRASTFAMDFAASRGDLTLLKHMHQDVNHRWSCTGSAVAASAASGDLCVVQWLVENRDEVQCSAWIEAASDSAARNGHLHILEWLRDNWSFTPPANCFVAALEGGHMQVLRWICDHSTVDPWSRLGGPSRVTMIEAACVSANRLEVLQWLLETTDTCTVTASAMSYVLSRGDIRTAQWLADPIGGGLELSDWDHVIAKWMSFAFALWHHSTLAKAALQGQLQIVQWLTKAGPLHQAETDTLWRCARRGHLNVVKFLLEDKLHVPKGVEFLPATWTSFVDSEDDNLALRAPHWEWHRLAHDPHWAKPYVELWLTFDLDACRRVDWLSTWAMHCGHVDIFTALSVESL